MDDVSLQLLDGHASATKRRCNHNLDLQGKRITLRGAGAGNTILDCGRGAAETTLDSPIASRGLVFVSGEDRDTVVEDLTIRHCRGSWHPNSYAATSVDDLRHAGILQNVGGGASNYIGGAVVMRNSGPTLRSVVIATSRANHGGAITMIGAAVDGIRPLLSNVSVSGTIANFEGGALFRDSTCFDWIGGTISGCQSWHGGSAMRLHHGCGSGSKGSVLENLVIEGNTNHAASLGGGALWIRGTSSPVTIRGVNFRNNVDDNVNPTRRARDIFITETSNYPGSVNLINNLHLASLSPSPPVMQVINSCDEVQHGYRGIVPGETATRTYLQGSDHMGTETRCAFVPTGGLKNLHLAAGNPLEFPVEGWNVVARREWQDGIDFVRTWEEYVAVVFFVLFLLDFSRHLLDLTCVVVVVFFSSASRSHRYKNGFGDLVTAFWMGNDRLAKWTERASQQLRVSFCTLDDRMSPVDVPIDADGTSDFSNWPSENDLVATVEGDGSVRVVRQGGSTIPLGSEQTYDGRTKRSASYNAACRCVTVSVDKAVSICQSGSTVCDASHTSPCKPKDVLANTMTFAQCQAECARINMVVPFSNAGIAKSLDTGCNFNEMERWVSSSSLGSGSYCLKVTTGDNTGTLDLYVHDGRVWQKELTGSHSEQNKVILEKCYPLPFVDVNVQNPTTDGWTGSILIKHKFDSHYTPMWCLTCGETLTKTDVLFADGNIETSSATSTCIDRARCKIVPPTSFGSYGFLHVIDLSAKINRAPVVECGWTLSVDKQ